jgi:hypothetical protein
MVSINPFPEAHAVGRRGDLIVVGKAAKVTAFAEFLAGVAGIHADRQFGITAVQDPDDTRQTGRLLHGLAAGERYARDRGLTQNPVGKLIGAKILAAERYMGVGVKAAWTSQITALKPNDGSNARTVDGRVLELGMNKQDNAFQ